MVDDKPNTSDQRAARQRIERLLAEQRFGVLCTQGDGESYGSLVAYVVGCDLVALAFATPKATHKYGLLRACPAVAMLIDSRSAHPAHAAEVEAVTATGQAVELPPGDERERWIAMLAQRHPELAFFFRAASSALFRIDVTRYVHVSRFQEVSHWEPS